MGLDEWKDLSTFEVELPSGTKVKGRFLDMETAVLAGGMDFSVLERLQKAGDKPPRQEDVAEGLRFKREVVKTCLLEVEGEPVKLNDVDYAALPEEDRTAFFGHANRSVPLAQEVSA